MSRLKHADESTREIWAPLIDEINSLVDVLCVLDNDETKCVDILAKHVERIQNTIPLKQVSMQYPKPIHRLLSIQPLKRIKIPLDVLNILVTSGFEVNAYCNDGSDYYDCWQHNKKTCLHLAVRNRHYNAARWLVKHGADCNKSSYEESLISYTYPYITPVILLASDRNAPIDLFSKAKSY